MQHKETVFSTVWSSVGMILLMAVSFTSLVLAWKTVEILVLIEILLEKSEVVFDNVSQRLFKNQPYLHEILKS